MDIRERIGRGSFGDVHRAYWRYTEVAVKKIFNPSDALLNELYDEARLMITLRHPNIVTFMACTAAQPELCIVTEYVSRGSLYKILHNKNIIFEIDHIRHMALGAAKGMAYLHGSHIIHRDLKSHNLLVDAHWNIKVGDFGLSRAVDQSGVNSTLTACGTPCWTAPEVLRSQRYSFMADVYSFGVCLWEMVTREDPYPGTPAYQVVISVATKNLRPKMPKHINPLCSELIVECWDESPEKRPAFGVLVDKLQSMSLPKSKSPPMVMEGDGSSQTLDSPKDPKGPNAKSAQLKNNMYI
uniref:Protein kinase domain-containing protein n=1 Tax=Arcella intermedia TaxID=1963864 RepID=A0A6B2L893_9EUKA